jgi:hypothetical protein
VRGAAAHVRSASAHTPRRPPPHWHRIDERRLPRVPRGAHGLRTPLRRHDARQRQRRPKHLRLPAGHGLCRLALPLPREARALQRALRRYAGRERQLRRVRKHRRRRARAHQQALPVRHRVHRRPQRRHLRRRGGQPLPRRSLLRTRTALRLGEGLRPAQRHLRVRSALPRGRRRRHRPAALPVRILPPEWGDAIVASETCVGGSRGLPIPP